MKKTISIITATYNAESVLEKLIKSVLVQKTNLIEFIIIDGASKDQTVDIIKRYNDIVDYWISEPDEGIYDAWNKGVRVATGEWIMFIGADDCFMPNVLNDLIDLTRNIQDDTIEYICAKNEYVDEKGRYLKMIGEEFNWNKMRKGMSLAHVASLHNRKLFSQVGLFSLDYKICSDYELLLRRGQNLKAIYFDKVLVKMQIGGASFSSKAIYETFLIRRKYKTLFLFANCWTYLKDKILFITFRIRKSIGKRFK